MYRSGCGSGTVTFGREENHGTEEEVEEQYGERRSLTNKSRVEGEEEEEELLAVLKRFRDNWTRTMSPYVGPIDETTGEGVGPKRYTESGPPRFGGIPYDAMEIFSLKVTELGGGLEWPLRVFGLVAVRDSMDYKRNVLFQRSKDDCQVLTAEDPYLVLIGPSRAIALIDPPGFEVELKVIGKTPSEEKVLSGLYFQYNNICNGSKVGQVQTIRESSERRSTIELKFAHMSIPLEATIEIYHSEGSSDFHGQFFARMDYMDKDEIVLHDSKGSKVTISSDGRVLLSRCVVLVEEGDELRLGVKAWQSGDGLNAPEHIAKFPAKIHSKSHGEFNVGFCKMSISVAWSVLV